MQSFCDSEWIINQNKKYLQKRKLSKLTRFCFFKEGQRKVKVSKWTEYSSGTKYPNNWCQNDLKWGPKRPKSVSVNRDTAQARHGQTSAALQISWESVCYSKGKCTVSRPMKSLDFLCLTCCTNLWIEDQLIIRRKYPIAQMRSKTYISHTVYRCL